MAPFAAAWLLSGLGAADAWAQPRAPVDEARDAVFVNAEAETYLRLLQVTGRAPSYPWSIRAFSAAEVDRLVPTDSTAPHPWVARFGVDSVRHGARLEWVRPRVRTVFNSAFPYGYNDGPVWAGKGATVSAEAGFVLRSGSLSLTVAPLVTMAQNADFELVPNGESGEAANGSLVDPQAIDFPRRFGDGRYFRVSPGNSTLRFDRGVAVGVSTAAQHWGPAVEFPLVLGDNAGGFPHVFVGTARPVNVWLGRVHGRLVWGRLSQSDYTTIPGDSATRFASAVVALFTPRGVDGLEVGASRFFHTAGGVGEVDVGDLFRPLGGILKGVGAENPDAENQIASVFARWNFPRSGFELYGEFARDDHNSTVRDLVLEPDHLSAFLLGFRKVWERPGRWTVLRGEWMDARTTHLRQVRAQAPFYIHRALRQGHTHEGQTLGSPAAFGGAGAVLAVDRYAPGGRWTLAWTRIQRGEQFTTDGSVADVQQALGVETFRRFPRFDLSAGVTGVWGLNRDFGDDALNVNAAIGLRARL